jgi:hypothetical protein
VITVTHSKKFFMTALIKNMILLKVERKQKIIFFSSFYTTKAVLIKTSVPLSNMLVNVILCDKILIVTTCDNQGPML